jgi:hypothetical protein
VALLEGALQVSRKGSRDKTHEKGPIEWGPSGGNGIFHESPGQGWIIHESSLLQMLGAADEAVALHRESAETQQMQ